MTSLPVIKVSASQLKTFLRCERQWAHEKIGSFEKGSSEATLKGNRCHSVWEAYLEFGTDPQDAVEGMYPDLPPQKKAEIVRITRATLGLLPLPGMARVEGEFLLRFPTQYGPGLMRGYIDWEILDQGEHDPDAIGNPQLPCDGVPQVGDHKTSKNVERYALTESALLRDIQGMIYAGKVLKKTGAEEVDLFWSYSQTTKKLAHPVKARASRDRVDQFWAETIIPTVERMIEVRTECDGDPMKAKPSPDECGAFGGCPHKARCPDVDQDAVLLSGITRAHPPKERDMAKSLLEQLKEEKAKSGSATAEVAIEPEDKPEPEAEVEEETEAEPPPERKRGSKAKPKVEPKAEPKAEPKPKSKSKPKAEALDLADDLEKAVKLVAVKAIERGEYVFGASLINALSWRVKGD